MKPHSALLALALALALPVSAPAQARTAAEFIAAIEGPQPTADPNDLGKLTIAELMARFNVPGVSVATITLEDGRLQPTPTGQNKATLFAQPRPAEWKLDATPRVTIGGDGSKNTEFLHVRNALRLADGRIIVANNATSELRIFDAKGAYLGAFGRKGQGPGEFAYTSWSERFGDTVIVYDGGLRRISFILFAGPPRLLSEIPVALENTNGESWICGRLSDGRWIVCGLAMPTPPGKGAYRIPGSVGVVNAKAAGKVEWLAEFPDGDAFVYVPPNNPNAVSLVVMAFPSAAQVVAGGSVVWFGDGKTDSLAQLSLTSGARKKTVIGPGAPVTKAMVDRAHARDLELARRPRDTAAAMMRYGTELLPRRLPSYESLLIGPRGELWVQRGAPSRVAPADYVIYSATGVLTARLTVPAGFRVTDVGLDYLAGIHHDDDGVETVRVYSLRRIQ
jgi:hypothetical protein